MSDFGYGGVIRALTFAARERGATVRTAAMPYPVRSADEVVGAFEAAITPNTRLAIVDHITSESALVLPLAAIAERCRARGVAVLADGAHAPGAIALDIPSLGVDWYVGNLHKWLWVPRSSGILWTSPERQKTLHASVISWGLDRGFHAEFDLPGTRDPSPHLSAPAAIAFMRTLGIEAVQRYNHALAWDGARHLAERWNTEFVTPEALHRHDGDGDAAGDAGIDPGGRRPAPRRAALRPSHRGAGARLSRPALRAHLRAGLHRAR